MERVLRVVDWLALTRRGQITAGLAEVAGIALAVALPRLGRHLRITDTP